LRLYGGLPLEHVASRAGAGRPSDAPFMSHCGLEGGLRLAYIR